LRQAYDYWQDQPGNYYPFAPECRNNTTATNGNKATFTDGSSLN
jgi:hypothetical protein